MTKRKSAAMGRKPLPDNLRRSEKIVVFLTPDEMKKIQDRISKTGEDQRDYARRVLVSGNA